MQLADDANKAPGIVPEGVPPGANERGAAGRHPAVGRLEPLHVCHCDGVVGVAFALVRHVDDDRRAHELVDGYGLDRGAALDEVGGSIDVSACVLGDMDHADEDAVLVMVEHDIEARRRHSRPHSHVISNGTAEINYSFDGSHQPLRWSGPSARAGR